MSGHANATSGIRGTWSGRLADFTRHGLSERKRIEQFAHDEKKKIRRDFTVKERLPEEASALRKRLSSIVKSNTYQGAFLLVILMDVVMIIVEANASASHTESPDWVRKGARFLTSMYVAELIVRFYIFQGQMLKSIWTIVDSCIVLMDLLAIFVNTYTDQITFINGEWEAITSLRLFRLVKLARSYKMLVLFPELSLMMRGLFGALKSVFWGIVLISFVLILFSIMAVYLIHPLNMDVLEHSAAHAECYRCARAYSSVQESMLTLFQQVIAGDSWGTHTIPIIEAYPYTAIYFTSLQIAYNLLLLNLILGLIMDSAIIARQGSDIEIAAERELNYLKAQADILDLFKELDVDSDGILTKEEIIEGSLALPSFQGCLAALDIPNDDIVAMCSILDHNGSNEVDYFEFAEELYRLKATNTNSCLIFIKHYVKEIQQQLEGECSQRLLKLEQLLLPIVSTLQHESAVLPPRPQAGQDALADGCPFRPEASIQDSACSLLATTDSGLSQGRRSPRRGANGHRGENDAGGPVAGIDLVRMDGCENGVGAIAANGIGVVRKDGCENGVGAIAANGIGVVRKDGCENGIGAHEQSPERPSAAKSPKSPRPEVVLVM